MKLSVIIPVYRVETTLDRCVSSVVGQTFTDMEIILVDDGSPDGCPALCDEWATRNGRIKVIHKQNGGLSDARNAALDVARGEYVTFVDSDDYLDKDTYAQVMNDRNLTSKNPDNEEVPPDIIEFPFLRYYGSPWQRMVSFANAHYDSAADYWLRGRAYEHCYVWNKVYRRTLFDGVRFPVGKVFEDVHTLPHLLEHSRSIATIAGGLYYYCHNPQGITATAEGPQLRMLLDAHLAVISRWCDDRYYMHVLNILTDVYEREDVCTSTLQQRNVSPFFPGLTNAQRLKVLALRTLGLKRLLKLSKTLHRWKTPSHS